MTSLFAVFAMAFLILFGYAIYLFNRIVELYEHQHYTDYKSYKESINENVGSFFKPSRKQDAVSIHEVKGDRQKITVKKKTGISNTKDTLVDLDKADPDMVMNSIDGFGKHKF
jgi:hypothetical protein